ncbi:hypothetical protein [Ornithinibacillus halophilus]|uniref:Uncharacterized protein n=1 Tax=Ornithinibacillus halophilus TaxID=930117 RepID=A0A1M5GSB5_9BACI|nr:hypothetical protein [Ornithinibacillus halophilus]SHG06402.1 hypothetical protein SAMN05216225_101429 [Ornithinibacillus halophilus]
MNKKVLIALFSKTTILLAFVLLFAFNSTNNNEILSNESTEVVVEQLDSIEE